VACAPRGRRPLTASVVKDRRPIAVRAPAPREAASTNAHRAARRRAGSAGRRASYVSRRRSPHPMASAWRGAPGLGAVAPSEPAIRRALPTRTSGVQTTESGAWVYDACVLRPSRATPIAPSTGRGRGWGAGGARETCPVQLDANRFRASSADWPSTVQRRPRVRRRRELWTRNAIRRPVVRRPRVTRRRRGSRRRGGRQRMARPTCWRQANPPAARAHRRRVLAAATIVRHLTRLGTSERNRACASLCVAESSAASTCVSAVEASDCDIAIGCCTRTVLVPTSSRRTRRSLCGSSWTQHHFAWERPPVGIVRAEQKFAAYLLERARRRGRVLPVPTATAARIDW
jgi:hypothetical protein